MTPSNRWTAWAGILAVFVVLGITLLSVVLAVGELV